MALVNGFLPICEFQNFKLDLKGQSLVGLEPKCARCHSVPLRGPAFHGSFHCPLKRVCDIHGLRVDLRTGDSTRITRRVKIFNHCR